MSTSSHVGRIHENSGKINAQIVHILVMQYIRKIKIIVNCKSRIIQGKENVLCGDCALGLSGSRGSVVE